MTWDLPTLGYSSVRDERVIMVARKAVDEINTAMLCSDYNVLLAWDTPDIHRSAKTSSTGLTEPAQSWRHDLEYRHDPKNIVSGGCIGPSDL